MSKLEKTQSASPKAPPKARRVPAWKNMCQYCDRPMPDNRDVLICGRCANTVATAKQSKPKGFYLHSR